MNKLINLIVDMAFRALKYSVMSPWNFIRRNFKTLLVVYILGIVPIGTYGLTSATTDVKPSNPAQVVSAVIESGPLNIATAGLAQPLMNGGKLALGEAQKVIADFTGDVDLLEKGHNLVQDSQSWFNLGSESNAQSDVAIVDSTPSEGVVDFDYNQYPQYYNVMSTANVDPSEFPAAGEYVYSDKDSLGRTGVAMATIDYHSTNVGCREINAKEECERDNFRSGDDPSGWGHNEKVSIPGQDGRTYNGYMYNRSHLIGDAIGGEATSENAVTGTRPQNVGNVDNAGGMRYTESKVEDYFSSATDEVVYYKAEPVYEGNELLPRYVIVTVMSSDQKLNEVVQVFNNANGWNINYADGTYSAQ